MVDVTAYTNGNAYITALKKEGHDILGAEQFEDNALQAIKTDLTELRKELFEIELDVEAIVGTEDERNKLFESLQDLATTAVRKRCIVELFAREAQKLSTLKIEDKHAGITSLQQIVQELKLPELPFTKVEAQLNALYAKLQALTRGKATATVNIVTDAGQEIETLKKLQEHADLLKKHFGF